jgi:hypothetical protein
MAQKFLHCANVIASSQQVTACGIIVTRPLSPIPSRTVISPCSKSESLTRRRSERKHVAAADKLDGCELAVCAVRDAKLEATRERRAEARHASRKFALARRSGYRDS